MLPNLDDSYPLSMFIYVLEKMHHILHMSKTLIIVSFFVEVAIFFGLALLFPIVADQFYGWFGGLFHGFLVIPNWIISWFADGHLLRAPLCSGAYNIWWLAGAVLGIISSMFYAVCLALTIVSKK